MAWTGLPQLLVIPLVPLLMKRISARLLVMLGLSIFAASCFMNVELDLNYAAPQLFWPDIIRAVGQALVMTPLSAIAMVEIARSEAGAASGMFNMMRNLGGAIGTAALQTFFTKREQFHSVIIGAHVSLLEPATRNRLAELQQYFMAQGLPGAAAAWHRAVIAVGDADPRAGDDHGLRRLLRHARDRAACCHSAGLDDEKGLRFRRRRTLGLERSALATMSLTIGGAGLRADLPACRLDRSPHRDGGERSAKAPGTELASAAGIVSTRESFRRHMGCAQPGTGAPYRR